jgi:hypothetical protein
VAQKIESTLEKTKSFIHQGYHQLGKWAGEVDRGAGIMRKMFSLATPMLDDFGGGDIIKKGIDAIGKYDQFKSQVSDIDQRARGYASTVDKANIFE